MEVDVHLFGIFPAGVPSLSSGDLGKINAKYESHLLAQLLGTDMNFDPQEPTWAMEAGLLWLLSPGTL